MKKFLLTLSSLAVLCLVSHTVDAKPSNESETTIFDTATIKGKISTGFDYSNGDYGQTQDTEIWYVPVTGKVEINDLTMKLTVPWISITGPSAVVGGGGGGGVIVASKPGVTTESGLGDVVGALTYTIDIPDNTYLDLTGKIKLPTASVSKGLGTGEYDYTLQADIMKVFGPLSVFGGVGRKFVGSNSTFKLQDIWMTNIGAGYDVTKDINLGLTYDWRESASRVQNPSELSPYVNFKITDTANIQLYGTVGFSDSSPNEGIGLTVGQKF